ncbi:MAG: hypothetical protein NC393_12225 [Clostridium sp.]|nr:hypothetical protein [Clostridium sp.]MCM1172874.1 hypothetical protein [Clostridium sp.]
MSVLQQEVVDKVTKLSDDNLQFILEMINRFMQLEEQDEKEVDFKRIGVAKGQKLYDDYDFDEMNDDIAKMFGVM